MSDEAKTPEQMIAEQNAVIATLLNQQQQTNNLLNQLAGRINTPTAKPEAPKLELTEEEIERPTAHTIAKIVAHSTSALKTDIEKSIAPLQHQTQNFARQSEYERLKAQMKAAPDYADVVNFEDLFDAIMANQPIDRDTMITAYNLAFARWTKMGGKVKESTTTTTTTQTDITPPHLAAPRPKTTGGGPKNIRALDTNEALLARQRGWSDARFLYEADEIGFDDYVAHEKKLNPTFDASKVRRHV